MSDTKAHQAEAEAQYDRLLIASHRDGLHEPGTHVECKLCQEALWRQVDTSYDTGTYTPHGDYLTTHATSEHDR